MGLQTIEVKGALDAVVIPSPLNDPARSAGLSYGDQIISVDGINVQKMRFAEIQKLVWFEKPEIKMTILKKGQTKSEIISIRKK